MDSLLRRMFSFAFFTIGAMATIKFFDPPFQCPSVIDTVLPIGQYSEYLYGRLEDPSDPEMQTMKEIHNTLSNCSSVKSLKLLLTKLQGEFEPDRNDFPFQYPSGSRYPSQLEVLDLEGYRFDEMPWEEARKMLSSTDSTFHKYLDWLGSGKAWSWLKWMWLSKQQKQMTNLDLWLEAMDFSRIKTLVLIPPEPSIFSRSKSHAPNSTQLAPHLKSLTSLTARGPWTGDLITALPENSLAHLAWLSSRRPWRLAEPVIRHHAKSLTSLEWRVSEAEADWRSSINPEQIAELGIMAPNLRDITIDMRQNDVWPYRHLEALATKFPKLENATLFFDMASYCRRAIDARKNRMLGRERWKMEMSSNCGPGEDEFAHPRLDVTSAQDMFEFLVERNEVGQLRKVTFYSGDWDRPREEHRWGSEWLDGKRTWANCWISEDLAEVKDAGNKYRHSEELWMVCQAGSKRQFHEIGSRRTIWDNDEWWWDRTMEQRIWKMEMGKSPANPFISQLCGSKTRGRIPEPSGLAQ
ncbi:hypothetical protein COL154_010663 [Colletotrichum chrysophilum]|nr:hypothetical protein COL154_010663 [Colletotrichum chrysophilum]